ncbi:6-hydroxy-D-nicotine oxidase [Aspergillus ellipticus CBS 707.79]|uniref:6-hydroxy-D-nicotine oxidase n=1 Tax=Aspergillus ellipticus CBS 707.79 TaxID=1448320 RepID=A0A319CWA1_9EURO|nr:6-hydroxy-D-nicotine oxidase [Aspergillus ellipticus CBS 707.79]
MDVSSPIATTTGSPSLDKLDNPEVETLLSKYATLSASEKDTFRASLASQNFVLLFGKNAILETSDEYESQRRVPWSTNCWLQPLVVVTPTSAQEIATALTLCRFFNLRLSVRGGGHLQNPGFNSNHGGVVISMSKFDQVKLSEDKSTADIGLGLRWLDVYKALDLHGLAVAGGRIPTVGVPGLLLGGGISFQNSQYGIGAMGVIVNSNADENTDLFWAVKGGGPNFGIITKMNLVTVPTTSWSEARIYPPTAYESLVHGLMQYHEAIETDNRASLVWHATSQAILLVFFYCAPVEKPPAAFASFYDIPFLMNFVPPGTRSIYELVQGCRKTRQEQQAALSDVEGLVLTNVFQPMSSLAMEQSQGTPLGLEPVGQQWFLAMADWKHAKDEARVRDAIREIVDVAEASAKEEGVYLPHRYSNYASRDQDPLASYGAENVERLRGVAGKYDPEGVFQRLQNGGWLLSKVGSS